MNKSMKRVAIAAVVIAGSACSQKQATNAQCAGPSLLDSSQGYRSYLCLEKKGSPRLLNGYTYEQAIVLVLAREDNAWKQLSTISETADRLDFLTRRARAGRDEYQKYPRVADITSVDITTTLDTGATVIGMQTADGVKASLWLEGPVKDTGRVRTVTPY